MNRRATAAAVALAALSIVPAAGWGQSPADKSGAELIASIRAAAELPHPSPQIALAMQRAELTRALTDLESLLDRAPLHEAHAWKAWLDWPQLQSAAVDETPDPERLADLGERRRRNVAGTEMPPFVAVRQALRGLADAAEYAAAAQPAELYAARLEELAERLARLEQASDAALPEEDDLHAAGRLAGWWRNVSGDPALPAAVAQRHGQSNGFLRASQPLLALLLEREIAERQTFADYALGAYLTGTAVTHGRLALQFVPSERTGVLELRVDGGTATPGTVARRGQVTVVSSGYTASAARKQVTIDQNGLHFAPAAVAAQSSLRIGDVQAPRRIVERIGWRRATRMLPEAEQSTARRISAELQTQVNELAEASLDEANHALCNLMLAPLKRLDAHPALLRFSTDQQRLGIELRQQDDRRLAASGPPPAHPADDLGAAIHESLINNLTERLFGGRDMRDRQWLELMNIVTGDKPRPLWVHQRSEPWSVVLQTDRPLSVRFAGDRADLALRLARVTRGDRSWELPVRIAVRYQPQISRDGPTFVREGSLEIELAGGAESEADLRDFLAWKFAAILPERLSFDGMTPPNGGRLAALRQLRLHELSCREGWLLIGYSLLDSAAERTASR